MIPAAPEKRTIPDLLAATVDQRGDQPALGTIHDGQLAWQTWRQVAEKTYAWAEELAARGAQPGDRVAQLSPNCEGWIIADLAMQLAGAVHVPLHVSLGGPQIGQQINNCGARLVIVSSADLAERVRGEVGPDVAIVLHAELPPPNSHIQPRPDHLPQGEDLATILYTSGTTGAPRGVMLSHWNIVANAVATADAVATDDDEVRLLILPLSHIYARTCDLYCWIYRGTRLVIAESRETALRDCQIAQPTVLNAVPYFYQKVADGLRANPAHADAAALRSCLGGAIRMLYCGGAALATEVETFFAERGLPILCGYGLTEAAPVITATTPECHSIGTVGRPLSNIELRLADDGEIQVRGPNVMRGYWHNEADTEAVLHDGWLSTGDLGAWAPNCNLRIIGRKKEMLVLSTGKKVAPTQIEQWLQGSPLIEQCCVLGDGQKCLGALIVPAADVLRQGLPAAQLRALYRQEIDRCLADAADFEQVRCFELLDRPFSMERGELTPKLSLCRKAIAGAFAKEIESMYGCMTDRIVDMIPPTRIEQTT
jgi:long-chain acyl-CoA synthetase